MGLVGKGADKDVKRGPEQGACHLSDRGVWINLIRGGEEQRSSVREAPVKSSKLINTVSM